MEKTVEDQLILLITKFYQETDNERRNDFETRLYSFIQDVNKAVPLLLNIIKEKNGFGVKTTCMVFLKKINYDQMNDEINNHFKKVCVDVIFSNLDFEVKKKFAKIIEFSIRPRLTNMKKNFIFLKNDFLKVLKQVCEKNEFFNNDVIGILLMLNVFYKSEGKFNFEKLFDQTFGILMKIYSNNVKQIIDNLESNNFYKVKIQNEIVQKQCEEYLMILNLYMKNIKQVIFTLKILDFDLEDLEKYKNLKEDQDFIQHIVKIAFFRIGNLTKNTKNIIFEITEFTSLNEKINRIKYKALFVMELLIKDFLKDKQKKNVFQVIYKSFIKVILESLYIFYQQKDINLDEIKEKKYLKQLLEKSIKINTTVLSNFNFFEIFSEIKKNIITDIIFINSFALQNEKDDFKSSAQEFINYTVSLIMPQKEVILKQFFNKFTKKMCKYIDGVLTFITLTVLDILKFCFNSENNINANYLFLDGIKNCTFFLNTDNDMKIEMGLYMLTIIYEEISERKDLIEKIDEFVKNYSRFIIQKNDFIKMRFIFFMAEFIKEIPKNDLNLKIDLLKFFLSSGENGCEALELALVENLYIISNDNFHKLSTEQFDKEILSSYTFILLKEIETKNSSSRNLECLNFVLRDKIEFLIKNPELFKKIIIVISNRILIEDSSEDKNKRKKEEKINKLWNTLKLVFDIKELVIQFSDFIEGTLGMFIPIIFQEDNKLKNWDEDLFECYNNFINLTKTLPKNSNDFFIIFPHILKCYENRITILRPLLNSFIYHSPDFFDSSKIEIFLNLIKNSINVKFENNFLAENYLADSLLLLQVFIQTIGNRLDKNHLIFCKDFHNKLLNCISQKDSIISKELLDKIDGIFLCLFIIVPDFCWEFYTEIELEQSVFRLIKYFLVFETFYEIKIFSMGLISLFESGIKKFPQKIDFFVNILNFLIIYMKFIQNFEIVKYYMKLKNKNSNRKLKEKELNFFEIHKTLLNKILDKKIENENRSKWYKCDDEQNNYSNQFDDEDEDEFFYTDNINITKKKLTAGIFSPILWKDEYEYLGRVLKNLKKDNYDYFNQLKNKMDVLSVNLMNSVAFYTHYIEISDNPKVVRLRKVVKYKRIKSN